MNECPYCGNEMTWTDSGEPDYFSGCWCDECREFFLEEELMDIAAEEDEE